MTQSNKHSKFRRLIQWCVAAWNSVPYVEHHRNHLTNEAKQLRTTITFLSVYLLAAVVNFILAISLPGIYSMKLFNIINGAVIGGMGGSSFGFVIACCAVFYKVIPERSSNRNNHISVAILQLFDEASEDLPGFKNAVVYRDFNIPVKNDDGSDVCKAMLEVWLCQFHHAFERSHTSVLSNDWWYSNFGQMNQTKCTVELADMFQGHLETKNGTQSS